MDLRSILMDHGFESAQSATTNIDLTQINQDLSNLSTYIDTTFADGIVTQIEAKRIQAYLNVLNDDNTKFQQQYDAIYNNADLTDQTIKDALLSAKTAYDADYAKIINDINNAIADGVATKDEGALVDNDYAVLTDDTKNLTTALENARNSILGQRSSVTLQSAQDYTDQAKKDITATTDQLNKDLYDANGYISTTFRDGVITQSESSTIQTYLNTLSTDKSAMDNRYAQISNNYFLTDAVAKSNLENAKTDYDTKYQNLVDSINNAIADNQVTVTENTAVNNNFVDYETAVANLSTYMEKAIDSLSQARADNAESLAKQYSDDNLKNVTDILDNMSNDNLITQNERITIKDDVSRIIGYIPVDTDFMPDLAAIDSSGKGEAYQTRQEALNAGVPQTSAEYTDVGNAYTALASYLNGMTPKPWDVTSTDNITVDKTAWRTNWLNYFVSIAEVKASVAQILNQNKLDTSTYNSDQVVVDQRITDVSNQVTISCYIRTSNGNIFKNGNISTTLTCIVMQGPNEVTSSYTASQFVWTRLSSDTAGDQTWNQNHINVGNQVTVTDADVNVRATFQCQVMSAN